MTDVVTVEYVNSVHMKVTADPGTRQEIMNYFSFRPDGYQLVPNSKQESGMAIFVFTSQ